MGKYDSYIIQKIRFLGSIIIFYVLCGVVTEFTMLHLRCLKYVTQTLLIPMMMNMTIYLNALAVKIIR